MAERRLDIDHVVLDVKRYAGIAAETNVVIRLLR
jgi:hypothetical protein